MKLEELFKKSAKIHWDKSSGKDYAEATFVVAGKQYLVYLEKVSPDIADIVLGEYIDAEDIWSVEFSISGGIDTSAISNRYGITGTGDAYEVFSSVIEALSEFTDRYNVDLFMFSASEPSRVSLYKRLTSKISKNAQSIERNDKTYFLVKP